MLTEAQLLEALRDCYDPDLPCNIVDLGLVLHTSITPDPDAPGSGIPGVPQRSRVGIDLLPTNPSDDAIAQLRAQITNRLAGLPSISHTTIHLRDQPPWSPQRISPAGRRTLGLDGNPNLIQIRPKPPTPR